MWKLINITFLFAILIAVTMVFNLSDVGLAQSDQASTLGPPQPEGGNATVVGVDQPDNCLRIRSGPGTEYDVIGCANMGDELKITGVWTSNDWAQLEDNGWVYGPKISADLRPPETAYSEPPTYAVTEGVVPDYDDSAYLPDYGYDTYYYGGAPIFFYNVAAWHRCHPWWWWRGCQAWWWQNGFHGRRPWDTNSFRNFSGTKGVNFAAVERANISALNSRGITTRSASIASSNVSKFNVNPSNITSSSVSRLNANRFNANPSNIRAFNANQFNTNRFGSGTTNAFRSRIFSTPYRSPSGSVNTFDSPTFSMPRTFSFGGSQFGGISRSGALTSLHIGASGLHPMGGAVGHR